MKTLFELCDTTDDEKYYTLGIFKTFTAAVNTIAIADKEGDRLGQEDGNNEVESFEIRRRPFGLVYSIGDKVYECTRECVYDEEEDEESWKTVSAWRKEGIE